MLFCMKCSHLHTFAWRLQKALILSMSNKIKQISVIYHHCMAAPRGDGGGDGASGWESKEAALREP